MMFPVGYFAPGYVAPGFFGAPVLPLDADEAVLRRLQSIVEGSLATAGIVLPVWTDEIPARAKTDPPGTDSRFPAVLIKLHDSNDVVGGGARRVMTWAEFQVRVIDIGLSFSKNSSAKAVIDQAIEAATRSLTSDGNYCVSKAYRRTSLRYPERSEATGIRYNHQGGIYRLMYFAMPPA